MRIVLKILVAFAALLAATASTAQEQRLALVITNAKYPAEIGALANPHTDGALIVGALKAVGFEDRNIAIIQDAGQAALRLAVAVFVERIE